MIKIAICALVLFGTLATINAWVPEAWGAGFNLPGTAFFVPYAALLCLTSLYFVYKAKF